MMAKGNLHEPFSETIGVVAVAATSTNLIDFEFERRLWREGYGRLMS